MKEFIIKFWYDFDEVYIHKLIAREDGNDLLILRDQDIGGIKALDVIKGYTNVTRVTFEPYDKNINYSSKKPVSNKDNQTSPPY